MHRLLKHKLAGIFTSTALAIATVGGAPPSSAAIIHGGGGGFHGGGFGGFHGGGFGGFHGGGFGGFHGGFGHGFGGFGHGFGGHFAGFGRGFGGAGHRFGGAHFGGSHFGGSHFAGNQFGGNHFGASRFGGRNQFAGGRQFNGNAFGTQAGWNGFAGNGWAGGWGGGWGGWGGGWGGWGGWVGPVFWPFLLGDLFSYALWPYDYYDPFWSYGTALAYDYGPYVPAQGYYGYNGPYNVYGYAGGGGNGAHVAIANANQIPPEVTQSCGGFAPGVASLPIDKIRQAIHPTGEQITFLDDLAVASTKASAILDASCPSEPPLTPLARLDAVETRLEASIQAIEIVRPPLVYLYDSLSDQQRQGLDGIGAKEAHGSGTAASGSSGALASLCGDQATDFTRLPSQRIQEIVKPTGPQETAFEDLKQASAKAADELRASCPRQSAEAFVARLDEMTARLNAMVQAVKSLRPTLATFYASLSDEQKAQFNNMGQSSGPPHGQG
jgi:uncharacterized protein YukE